MKFSGLSVAAFVWPMSAQLLTGCTQSLDIDVTSENGLVVFSIPKTEPPCVDRLAVYEASDPKNPIWLIDSANQMQCLTRFYYGKVPAGFDQRGSLEPLDPGKLYRVSIDQPGAIGIAFFSPGNDGLIERDPPAQ